jgi:hypothetical protein
MCEEDGGVGSSLLFVLLRSCFHDGSEVEQGCSVFRVRETRVSDFII